MNRSDRIHPPGWAKVVGGSIAIVGVILGAWQYVDSEFDDTRALINQRHEEMLQAYSTSQDDLNYRMGVHQGEHAAEWRELAEMWAKKRDGQSDQ